MMLHTKYQGSIGLMVSDKKIFLCFSLYKPMLNMRPLRLEHFWSKGHYLNKLGSGSLGDASYQISRL